MISTHKKVSRKSIPRKEAELVAMLSGNACANPCCKNSLVINIGNDYSRVGELAHIIAASERGPRGEGDFSERERNAARNIILLCANCHKLIDSNPEYFTADKLIAWKREHEAQVIINKANQNLVKKEFNRCDNSHDFPGNISVLLDGKDIENQMENIFVSNYCTEYDEWKSSLFLYNDGSGFDPSSYFIVQGCKLLIDSDYFMSAIRALLPHKLLRSCIVADFAIYDADDVHSYPISDVKFEVFLIPKPACTNELQKLVNNIFYKLERVGNWHSTDCRSRAYESLVFWLIRTNSFSLVVDWIVNELKSPMKPYLMFLAHVVRHAKLSNDSGDHSKLMEFIQGTKLLNEHQKYYLKDVTKGTWFPGWFGS